jgi:hypothetical protein
MRASINRYRRFPTTVAALLLAVSLTGCVDSSSASGTAGRDQATGSTAVVNPAVPSPGAITEIYAIPAPKPQDDGSLYSRAAGASGTDEFMAQGTDVMDIQAVTSDAAATPIVQWHSSADAATILARPGQSTLRLDAGLLKAPLPSLNVASLAVPLTSLESRGTRYVQMGDVVVAAQNGAVVAIYKLPELTPDQTAGQFPPGYKGVYTGTGVGEVSALVPTSDGDILAFSFTGRAAAVTDLMTSRTVPFAGYSKLGAAARAPSGQFIVLAWSALDESRSIKVLSIDPHSLQPVVTADTGITPAGHLRDRVLPGIGHDAVIGIAHGDEAAGVALDLWTVDGNSLLRRPALPKDSGLEIAPAGSTSVYVYNGPAKNTVGKLDLSTGSFTLDIPELRAPAGAYVVGIMSS